MIKLRLKKYGRKGQPCYRIVAMNSTTKRDGRSIEELGFYNPMTDETHLKFQRIIKRLKEGAQPSETVKNLLIKTKYFFPHAPSPSNQKSPRKRSRSTQRKTSSTQEN